MKVILKEDIKNLGKTGDVVNVSDGYAKNFLIPKKIVVEANTKNIKSIEHEKRKIQEHTRKVRGIANEMAGKISATTIILEATAGEEGKLFGSITTMDISAALKDKGFDIDRKKIVLEEPIKRLGDYTVDIKVYPEITSRLNIQVVSK